MFRSRTIWEQSLALEAARVVHICHYVANGFYRVNNYVVVPENYAGDKIDLVILPDLNYLGIDKFWEQAGRLDINDVPVKINKNIEKALVELLGLVGYQNPNIEKTKDLWQKIENDFFEALEQILPKSTKTFKNIYIYPSKYGTRASFSVGKLDIHIHLREDAGLYSLTSAILLSLTRQIVYDKYQGLWSESQLLVDWLIGETVLSKIISKAQPVRKIKPSMVATRCYVSKKTLEASGEFYKRLGLTVDNLTFEAVDKNIKVGNKNLKNLSINENKILSNLVLHKGRVVTYDQLGALMFKNEEDFSLYAISKSIERLRKKLEFNGITGSVIRTARGEGFVLS